MMQFRKVYLKPLPPFRRFLLRMLRSFGLATLVLGVGLGIGILGYRDIVGLSWIDSLLNASMILAGEGPLAPTVTTGGKLFASFYSLFSGLVFVTVTALLVAPVIRRVLHRFHLENFIDQDDASGEHGDTDKRLK